MTARYLFWNSARTSPGRSSGSADGHGAPGSNMSRTDSLPSTSFRSVDRATAHASDERWASSWRNRGGVRPSGRHAKFSFGNCVEGKSDALRLVLLMMSDDVLAGLGGMTSHVPLRTLLGSSTGVPANGEFGVSTKLRLCDRPRRKLLLMLLPTLRQSSALSLKWSNPLIDLRGKANVGTASNSFSQSYADLSTEWHTSSPTLLPPLRPRSRVRFNLFKSSWSKKLGGRASSYCLLCK